MKKTLASVFLSSVLLFTACGEWEEPRPETTIDSELSARLVRKIERVRSTWTVRQDFYAVTAEGVNDETVRQSFRDSVNAFEIKTLLGDLEFIKEKFPVDKLDSVAVAGYKEFLTWADSVMAAVPVKK